MIKRNDSYLVIVKFVKLLCLALFRLRAGLRSNVFAAVKHGEGGKKRKSDRIQAPKNTIGEEGIFKYVKSPFGGKTDNILRRAERPLSEAGYSGVGSGVEIVNNFLVNRFKKAIEAGVCENPIIKSIDNKEVIIEYGIKCNDWEGNSWFTRIKHPYTLKQVGLV